MKDISIWMYMVLWVMWVINCGLSFANGDIVQGNLFLVGFVLLGAVMAGLQKLDDIKENL